MPKTEKFRFIPSVWRQEAWGFGQNDIDDFRKIASDLAEFNAALTLARTRRQAKTTLKKRYKRRYAELRKMVARFDLSVGELFPLIQPAIVLREVWLWQMLRLRGRADRSDAKYQRMHEAVGVLSADGSALEGQLRAYLVMRLRDATLIDGFPLPDLTLGWGPRQLKLLEKCGGPRVLTGQELWEKQKYSHLRARKYAESKSRYWLPAMRVLSDKLLSQLNKRNRSRIESGKKPLDKLDAYSTVYYFLNALFPETFDKFPDRMKAAELVRCRLIPPKPLRANKRKPQIAVSQIVER